MTAEGWMPDLTAFTYVGPADLWTCKTCGAAVTSAAAPLHRNWHEVQDQARA